MDKLKTRVLFISLIILALVSISAVAAADSDEVISDTQDNFDLSEETVSDEPQDELLSSAESDVLTADDDYSYEITYKSTSGNQVATASHPNGWTMSAAKLAAVTGVKPTNPSKYNFTYKDVRYVFDHWEEVFDDGTNVTVDADYRVVLGPPSEVHHRNYRAIYQEILPGNLTVNNIDKIAHGSHMWCTTADNVNYYHTYSTPADIPDSAEFLYWEREDTGDKFYDGDVLSVTVDEYRDKTLVINVYAVYNIYTSIELEEITGYVEDKVDITATITENLNGKAVPGGTATLTIDYTEKLSNGLLRASTYTQEAEVAEDGTVVFKDVPLENPGTYKYTVSYGGYHYGVLKEGINDYLSTEADSKVNILPLDTTTTADDVSGTAGDKVTITADIVDQNGNPVKNGTAVLKINGKEYKTNVTNGKAVFKNVELPSESTEATIEYLGNDYYNPSNTTIQITVTQPEEPEDEPADEPEEEPSTPTAEKAVPVVPAAGNPIALVVLALLTLVSTVSLGRKK